MVIHANGVFNDFVAAHRSASASCGAVAATVSGAKRTHKYIGGHMAKRKTPAKRTLIQHRNRQAVCSAEHTRSI